MVAAKHTSGSWEFTKRGQRIYRGRTANVHVAQVQINPDWEANGHLLSAAPDMLHALREAEAFMAGFEGDELQDGIDALLKQARAAIAKAEGVAA